MTRIVLGRSDARRAVLVTALLLAGLGASVFPGPRQVVSRFADPATVADRSTVAAQRQAVERSLARGYGAAAQQVHRVATELVLPISREEAAALEAKAVSDLRAIRQAALRTLAARLGSDAAVAEAYVRAVDPQLESDASAAAPGILLAPDLYAIVAKADAQYAQASDEAVREITKPRSPTPKPSRP